MTINDHQVYTVPGLGGSGPGHWQTLWERAHPGWTRVAQSDWNEPDLELWAGAVAAAVGQGSRAVLIAHSFGCLAAVRAAQMLGETVAAALLVAPADPSRFGLEAQVGRALACPAVVAASRNDPWLAWKRAAPLARTWEAALIDLGPCGHVNTEAGFGPWPAGERLLARLLARLEASRAAARRVG